MKTKAAAAGPSLGELQARLRAAGLKSTSPRVAVLRHLENAGAPVSHADIIDALAASGFDRATLYRNLVDLSDAGLVSRTDLGDRVWRYERKREGAGEDGDHAHFVCTDCGDVACLPGVTVTISAPDSAPRAVQAPNVTVQLKGRCDRCT